MPEFDTRTDYYEVLQVHHKADAAVIRSAYRAILKELHAHPDLGGDHERAILINEAYRVLSNSRLREEYDRARAFLLAPVPHKTEKDARHTSDGWEELTCPSCGRPNRLREGMAKEKLFCGACRSPLYPGDGGEIIDFRRRRAKHEDNRLHLPGHLFDELKSRGEIELRTSRLPRGGKITCRRCRRVWTAQAPETVAKECPHCAATDWNAFRLLKCKHCGYEFSSFSLKRNAYLLFPYCPACGRAKWHAGLEASPIANLMRLFKTPQ